MGLLSRVTESKVMNWILEWARPSAVMRASHYSVVIKQKLSKAKLSIFKTVFPHFPLSWRKRLRIAGNSEKKTPWWNQEVEEAIQAKKDAFNAWLQDRSSSDLQSRYSEARKAATSAVKKFKEKSWEEFGLQLDSNYSSANKVFWQTIRRLRGKRLSVMYSIKHSAGSVLTDEN